MALNLRAPQSERSQSERYEPEVDHELSGGPRFGTALSDWEREDASRNPLGWSPEPSPAIGGGRRLIRGGFALLALTGFVGVLWYAYQWGLGGSDTVELPTVQAETGADKEKPSDPGGLQVPYQDQLVLNEDEAGADGPKVERLLPPPEVPLPTPSLTSIAPSYDEELAAGAVEGETGLVTGADTAGSASATGEAALSAQQSANIPAIPEAPSSSQTASQATAQPSTEAVEPTTNESAAAEPQAAESQPSAPESTASQAASTETTTTQSTTTQTATTQAAATQATATQATGGAGNFAVQLVSLKDKKAATQEWTRLQGIFPNLLGDKSLLLQSAEVSGVGKVYRLRAGPFTTKASAAKVCKQLKSKQQDCLVVSR